MDANDSNNTGPLVRLTKETAMERGSVAQIRRYGAAAALPVFLALPCFALSDPLILSRPEEVRTLVREAQAAALPSATATTQDIGMVSVSPLDARTATWFGAVGPGEAVAFEDSATADTVLTNPVSGGASRLPAEVGYDPFGIFSVAGYDFKTNPELLPFYDPALVAVAMQLVPEPDPGPVESGIGAGEGSGTGENGASGQSFSVSWVPFDICNETSAVVRAGDSMLLAASASGGRDAEISVAGPATNASFAVVSGQTVPFEFRNPGEYGISASWIDQSGEYRTASAAVAAVSGSLPPCIPLWAGKYNAVRLPEVPHTGAALVLEDFFEAETFSPAQSGGWRGAASPSMEDFLSGKASGFVALQLGGSDGAVLDSAPVLPFWPLWTLDGEYRIVETLPDGTRVAETVVHCPDLPEGVELELWCYNAGFCFEDGGATLRFSREDLRENGTFACRTLLSGEAVHPCQFLRAFYNGLKTVD